MKEISKIDNKILKNPQNYAAIYARVSTKKDNNSIDAQINEAKAVLNKKNLLVYGVYTDNVSGHTTSPPERSGFGKLLEDAKAGCFKTLIAYKHDRIARNLNDWINLKAELRKLKIQIIFSDTSEYSCDNSLQGDFLENLIIMVGELEPNVIKERASNGRQQRRIQGVYNSAKNIPFGYTRETASSKILSKDDPSVGKSYYKIQPLKAVFIQHLYCEAKDVLGNKEIKYKTIILTLQNSIDSISKLGSLEAISDMLLNYATTIKLRLVKNHEKETYLEKIIEILKEYLLKNTLEYIQKELKDISIHLSKTSNVQSILKNPIYAGYILIESNEENKGIVIENKIPKLKEDSFNKTINIATIIDKKTFAKVYTYILMSDISKEKVPDFLFKSKLKCGYCNGNLNFTNGLLQCTKVGAKNSRCKSFAKNSVIEAVLDIILDDAFENSKDGFNSFRNTIVKKLASLRKDLEKLRNTKIILLKKYLSSKDKMYAQAIQSNENDVNALLQKISSYANELSYTNKFKAIIDYFNSTDTESKKSNSDIVRIKASIISYIVSNQDVFNPIFDKLINEIKVNVIEQKDNITCRFTVNYEFHYKEPSVISACIH
jgi:DNA invertase Pin-like site-specific DNA recombinase/cob(I)alamin adenosyltransferase